MTAAKELISEIETHTKVCLKHLDNAYKNTAIYEQGVQ
jgi:hypothetical protein